MKELLLILTLITGYVSNATTNPLPNKVKTTTPLFVMVHTSEILCFGERDGQILINATGGTAPYTYQIRKGNFAVFSLLTLSTSYVFNALESGVYEVTVTDFNNNSVSETLTITAPSTPLFATAATIDGCGEALDGMISVTATGGTPPYAYSIDGAHFSTNNSFTTSTPGDYSITVRDANGCAIGISTIVNSTSIATGITHSENRLISNETEANSYQWVICDTPNTPILNATEASFLPDNDGSYAVIIRKDNCELTSECFIFTTLSNNFHSSVKPSTIVYPNPIRNTLNIAFKSLEETIELQLYNTSGKLIFTDFYRNRDKVQLPVNMPSGIYFLNLVTKKRNETLKIRVE